jgi:hypothetical protein
MAWFGGEGTLADNLIAILVNAIAFAYFWKVLRDDWRANLPENYLPETRRLYRYIWLVFSLGLTVIGAYNLLQFLFSLPGSGIQTTAAVISGAVSLLITGVPLLLYHWNSIQAAAAVSSEERRSQLRLVVLYLISLAGVIGVIAAGGRVLGSLILWVSGEVNTLGGFLRDSSEELAAAIALGAMWWYYGRVLRRELAALPDLPQREGLARLYDYVLAFLGLAVAYAGMFTLVEFVGKVLFESSLNNNSESLRETLSSGLSALLVGVPLWLVPWREMQREVEGRGGPASGKGGRARRSVIRKAYLYLVLFLLIIAAMVFSGRLLYMLLNALLAQPESDLGYGVTTMALTLMATAGLLVYHLRVLREDGRTAQQEQGNLHAAFPTLILVEESESPRSADERGFANQVVEMLGRIAPRLPVAVHSMERGAPDDAMLDAKAIMLPAALMVDQPEALRLWLNEFQGQRILLPFTRDDWFWLGQQKRRNEELAREAAESLRQIAEGGAVRARLPGNPWVLAGYILGGIFGLILLFIIFSILFSSLIR